MTEVEIKAKGASDALQRLLKRDAPAGYLEETAAEIAAQKTALQGNTRGIVLFELAGECLALSLDLVQEVAHDCGFHRLPCKSQNAVAGLVNVRGELLVCISLEQLLGLVPTVLQASAPGRVGQLLVCEHNGLRLAFPVKKVLSIIQYYTEDSFAVPATLGGSKSKLSTALLLWQGRTVGCLDSTLLYEALTKICHEPRKANGH